jgi:hypothetical protein
MPEDISAEKSMAMLTRRYDISDKLDNTVLGVFIGIIAGVKIEAFMNVENSCSKWILVSCCVISVVLLVVAICINSSFVSKCLDLAKEPQYKESETIKKNIANSCLLRRSYWLCLIFSIVIFGIGIYNFKSTISPTPNQIICECNTGVANFVK